MFRDSPQDPLFVGVSGMVRKSALLCQLHDGPSLFAPALGGVQEAGFAYAWRAGPSVSQALCSSCASSLDSSRAVCAASHGPASDPGRSRFGSPSRIAPGRTPWRSVFAACASGRGAEWQRQRKAPTEAAPMACFSIVDGSRQPGVALGITGDHSARVAVRGGVGCVRRRAKG